MNTHQLKRIEFLYDDLDSKAQELYNLSILSGLLIHQGYYTVPLPHDTNGADFIAIPLVAHHVSEELHIQLKSRPTTDYEYLNKGLHIAFPVKGEWFVLDYNQWHEFATSRYSADDHSRWSNKTIRMDYLEELRQIALFDFYSIDPSSRSSESKFRQTWLNPRID